ncbi:hypothetical protein L1049_019109 [Liquidambar formosana]|uniref:Uncharacterized protein n=1 Tax=Liquidambar formosana TaxID=63359 RepID=A0AAP0RC30_LIQFO
MVDILLTALLLSFLPQYPCLSSEESTFSLSYYGGNIMTEPVTVSLLWFGSGWEESGTEAIKNAITSLTPPQYPVKDSEVPTLRNWWEIIRQYRDSDNVPVTDRVDVGVECFYTGPQLNMTLDQVVGIGQSVFNKTSIDGFGGNLSCNGVFGVKDSSIYYVVFSHTVKFLDRREQRELINLCSGNFETEVSTGVMVRFAWARAPQNAADQCSTFFHGSFYLGPPNGDEKIDSLVGYMLAKIAEEVTNPDGRGWISDDGSGLTVNSFCASLFRREAGPPLFMDAQRNVSFNAVGLNGYRYMVQYIWDQKIRNCALKLSETCGTNPVMFKQPKGNLNEGIIVNHTNGLQPYPPNQKCRWKIYYPTAKFISFTINYLSVAADNLMICQSELNPTQCSTLQSNSGNSKNFKLKGSKAYIEFTSGDYVATESRGWELSYSAGLCSGKEDIYAREGVIGYTSSIGFPYVEGLSCQWVLHGKPGTLVSLSFTHINISKGFDFLGIYNGTMRQMANFSGVYSGSNLPQMNLTGRVMVSFATQTDEGEGWSANFYISSPVDQNKEGLLFIIAIVLAVVAISFSLAFITLAVLRRRRKHMNSMDSFENLMSIRVEISREENRIGEGPSAIVYRAISTDGSSVAVKSPKETTPQTELEEEILLKSSCHPNIISLVGCAQDGIRGHYLVFEFMARGSLSWNLREKGETLDWEKRLEIALQISSAIQMLHMYSNPPIYHGNIRSENVLLDEFYNAKLGGFGAANYCKNNGRDPENPSEMAEDIGSFGFLLVELLRGDPLVIRRASEPFRSLEEINELVGGQECLDARLDIPKEDCKIMSLSKLGEIAKWCISSCQKIGGDENSPKISDVMLSLKQVKQLFCAVSS